MVTMMLSPDGYLIKSRQKRGVGRYAVIVEDIGYVECTRFLNELLGGYSLAEYYRAVLRLLPLNLEREIARMAYHYHNLNYNGCSYNTRRREFVFKEELRDNDVVDGGADTAAQSAIKKICEYLIEHYGELEKEQREYYFGKADAESGGFSCWRQAYPLFIACARGQGKTELFKRLVNNYEIIKRG